MTLKCIILLLGLSLGLQAQEGLRYSSAFDTIRSRASFANTYPIGQFGDTVLVYSQWTIPQILGFNSQSLELLFRKDLYVNLPLAAHSESTIPREEGFGDIVNISFDTTIAYPQGFLVF